MTERPFPPTPAPGLTTSVQFGCDGRWWSEAQMHDYVRADRLAAAPAAQPDWEQAILREWALAYPRMDIHAKPGTLVMFDGRGGYEMEQEHARKTLTMRGLYEVERTTVHSSSSTVHLRGVDGEWNTVMFSKPPVSEPAAQPTTLTPTAAQLERIEAWGREVFSNEMHPSDLAQNVQELFAAAQPPAQPVQAEPTDAEIMAIAGQWFVTGENLHKPDGYYYRSLGTPSNVRGSDLIEFARALIAALAAAPAAQPEGAKADTERLDYLQRRGSTVDLPMRAGRLVFRVGGWSIAVDADLRTAIDKARFAAAPQEPQ